MFDRLENMIGKGALDLLRTKTVLIVGLGGVGGYVVEALARSGIGHLVLVDPDTVDESNRNRQLIALESTTGRKKVEVWKERILEINPDCQVTGYDFAYSKETKEKIFARTPDFVIDACDTVHAKQSLIRSCLEAGIPFLSCMGTGYRLDPSALVIMDLKKTENDPLAKVLRKWARDEHIKGNIPVVCSRELPIKTESKQIASCAFVPGTAGLLMASYVIRSFVLNEKEVY